MTRAYCRMRLYDRHTWIPLLVLLSFSICAMLIPGIVPMASWDSTFQFFDGHFTMFFSVFTVALVEIPLYFVFLLANQYFFFNTAVYVRFPDSRSYWGKRFLALAGDAAVYTLFLHLLLLSHFVFLGQTALLPGKWKFLLICFLVQSLSYCAFGALFAVLAFAFKSTTVSFFCIYGLVAVDYLASTGHWLSKFDGDSQPLFFLRAICLDPVHTGRYGSMALLMAGLIVGLFLIASALFEDRDFLSKKVS